MIANTSLPLRHDLVCIRQVTPRVLHLCRVGVTDLVIGAAVVGALNHDDVGARAAQLDGVALAGQLPPHHRHGDWRSTEGCREKETECKCDLFWFLPFCFTVVKGFNRARLYRGYNSILVSGFVEKISLNIPTGKYKNRREDLQSKGPTLRHMRRGCPPWSRECGRTGRRLLGVGGWAIPQRPLRSQGVVERESARLTRIKHKEIDTVFAFGCEKINIHYTSIQLRN